MRTDREGVGKPPLVVALAFAVGFKFARHRYHPRPAAPLSPYRLSGRSSPGGCSSRGVGGVVDVGPRLSGRSSPGGGSSLGEASSVLGVPGGATSSSSRGTASRPSSGSGMTEAVPLALLLSSQKASTTVTAIARTPTPTPKALPLAPLARPVLDGPNRRPTFPRASMACPTASLRLVLLLRPKRSHMLLPPLPYGRSTTLQLSSPC